MASMTKRDERRRDRRRQRMAGERLSPEMNQGDANGRAGEEQTLSQTRNDNPSLEDRFGAEAVAKMQPKGLNDATERGSFSKKELLSEMRGRGKDVDTDAIKEQFQGYIDEGSSFTGKARAYLEKLGLSGAKGPGKEPPIQKDPMPTLPDPETPDTPPAPPVEGGPEPEPPGPAPVPPPSGGVPRPPVRYPGGISISQQQNISQDNDISTNITGDGNTVNNNQDNSISQSASVGGGYLADWMKKYLTK